MAVTVQWGPKSFVVSPGQVVPVRDLTTGYSRKSETNNDTSGQPTTNTTGLELQQVKFSTTYMIAAGVDPITEIADWKSHFGKQYPLILNGQQFGPDLMELVSVDFSNLKLDNNGRILSMGEANSFEEFVPQPNSVDQKKDEQQSDAGTAEGAMFAGPSTTEKANKKETPAR